MSSEFPKVGEIAFGADLVTVLRGTSYYKLHYYFNDSNKDIIQKYRNSVSFNYLDPQSENFQYWTVQNAIVSANLFNEDGLTSDISAYMTSIEPWTLTYVDDSTGSTIPDTLTFDVKKQVLEKNGNIVYSNTYPSVILPDPATTIYTIDQPKKFQYWLVYGENNFNQISADLDLCIQIENDKLSAKIVWKDLVTLNIANVSLPVTEGNEIKYDCYKYGGNEYCYANSTIDISAIPKKNWHLKSWSDTTIIDSIRNIHAENEQLDLTATFEKDIHVLSVHVANPDRGYIDASGYDINHYDFQLTNTFDTTVTLQAIVSSPYKFAGWSDGEVKATRKIQLSSDINVVANFCVGGINYVYLKANDSTLGKIYQSGYGEYLTGELVTLSAIPNPGSKFVQWSDQSGLNESEKDGNIRQIEVTSNICYIAEFADDGIIVDDTENMIVFNIDKEEVSYIIYNI